MRAAAMRASFAARQLQPLVRRRHAQAASHIWRSASRATSAFTASRSRSRFEKMPMRPPRQPVPSAAIAQSATPASDLLVPPDSGEATLLCGGHAPRRQRDRGLVPHLTRSSPSPADSVKGEVRSPRTFSDPNDLGPRRLEVDGVGPPRGADRQEPCVQPGKWVLLARTRGLA